MGSKLETFLFLTALPFALVFFIFTIYVATRNIPTETDRVYAFCKYIAPIRKEEYKNTQWKDFDFYQSCLDNNFCTTPYSNPCRERK